MTEVVMMMNGYDLDMANENKSSFVIPTPTESANRLAGDEPSTEEEERDNEIYSVNGRAFEYRDHPITIGTNQPLRIYLVNMLEFDLLNSFHLHGSMFKYYPAGTEHTTPYVTDVVAMGQGDRGILETYFPYPGMYMFHAHVTEFSELGWMGAFMAIDPLHPSSSHTGATAPAPAPAPALAPTSVPTPAVGAAPVPIPAAATTHSLMPMPMPMSTTTTQQPVTITPTTVTPTPPATTHSLIPVPAAVQAPTTPTTSSGGGIVVS